LKYKSLSYVHSLGSFGLRRKVGALARYNIRESAFEEDAFGPC
jgi:hypothetical protein